MNNKQLAFDGLQTLDFINGAMIKWEMEVNTRVEDFAKMNEHVIFLIPDIAQINDAYLKERVKIMLEKYDEISNFMNIAKNETVNNIHLYEYSGFIEHFTDIAYNDLQLNAQEQQNFMTILHTFDAVPDVIQRNDNTLKKIIRDHIDCYRAFIGYYDRIYY